MKSKMTMVIICVAAMMVCSCGVPVEVPPAHVGKMSTADGLQEGIIQPSKLRLTSWCLKCPDLILAEASDWPKKEPIPIFMPKDKLNLSVDVRGTFAISPAEANVERIFGRVTAQPRTQGDDGARVKVITMDRVYQTYAEAAVREVVRAELVKHSIADVMSNREAISAELFRLMKERLAQSPITVIQFGLADVQPPAVIVEAQVAAKKREVEIQKAEADKAVRIAEADADLAVAGKRRQVDLMEAETQVQIRRKLSKDVSQEWVRMRALQIIEQLVHKDSPHKLVMLSDKALQDPAAILGSFQLISGGRSGVQAIVANGQAGN